VAIMYPDNCRFSMIYHQQGTSCNFLKNYDDGPDDVLSCTISLVYHVRYNAELVISTFSGNLYSRNPCADEIRGEKYCWSGWIREMIFGAALRRKGIIMPRSSISP
jgi:hypothetical protein